MGIVGVAAMMIAGVDLVTTEIGGMIEVHLDTIETEEMIEDTTEIDGMTEERPAYGGRDSRDRGEERKVEEKKEEKEPQMKKYEEPEPPVVVATNKFAFLS